MGKERGYIKIYRIGDNWKADELFKAEPLCKWAAWVDLISLAEFRDGTIYVHKAEVKTKRGSVYVSIRKLAERWRWSVNKVIRFLKTLESQGKTETLNGSLINCISILNYDKYQGNGDTDGDTDGDTLYTKNTKKEKNTKKIIAAKAASSGKPDVKATQARRRDEIDFKSFIEFFNSTMDAAGSQISRLHTISDRRKAALNARTKEHGKQALATVVRKAAASDFLNGGGGRQFIATFDWLMRPNNFPKVLDGNYDNKDIAPKPTTTQNPSDNGNHSRFISKSESDRALDEADRQDLIKLGIDPDKFKQLDPTADLPF